MNLEFSDRDQALAIEIQTLGDSNFVVCNRRSDPSSVQRLQIGELSLKPALVCSIEGIRSNVLLVVTSMFLFCS